jgi:predicted GTPase
MPYGRLDAQAVQRFASAEDLDRYQCTIEEREEYEPYIRRGLVIYAGVDYSAILKAAEEEAEIILWDGGNNDFAFFKPDLQIVVCDALRAGHGLNYYPGETNFRSADILVVNKVAQAAPDAIQTILDLKARLNPGADVVQSDLEVDVEEPEGLTGARVLIVEDGPTVTHGGMAFGAGWVAAQQCRVGDIIDPRPHAVGSINETFAANPHLQRVLPAMGYSAAQRDELRATIEASGAELVINASPADIATLLGLSVPVVQVRYRWFQRSGPDVVKAVSALLA